MKRFLPIASLLLLLGLFGCASAGNYMMVCPISDGQNVNILLTKNGPENAEDDDVKVLFGNFMITGEKKVGYSFIIQMKSNATLAKVRVDNVTDATPELILEDTAPKLTPTNHWQGAAVINADMNGNMAWLNHDTTTMRIYRLTITYADGHKSVLYQPSSVPPFVKPILKERLGVTKPSDTEAK